MRRREFVLGAAALGGAGVGLYGYSQRIRASVEYPGRELGHWLRDHASLPAPSETLDTEVLIAGSGVAGLTADRLRASFHQVRAGRTHPDTRSSTVSGRFDHRRSPLCEVPPSWQRSPPPILIQRQ